ncbi:GNAT family N-acetyltransferase [Paenibacillus antri]|uniref:GNAT family N-acetyltransferase n=1 Tax=Paenibacillus antri TaxID=2582848 RepID=A0A5R9FZU3_9BACL|nr:GNAT family protein [Paenibacillus antri]TLS49572.1 GNAT family N-acetyltransferase [Paenibacillus antri]
MKLITERLTIRDFVFDDWKEVHAYASSSLVATHMIWGPNTEAETQSFIERTFEMQNQTPRKDYELAVTLSSGGELIGGVGLHVEAVGVGEIGYCLNPQYWRKGFASEAAREILRFGFSDLGLHRMYATCRPENVGSASVMKKIGMTYEGHLREHLFAKGKWHDSYQYSILAKEWFALEKG